MIGSTLPTVLEVVRLRRNSAKAFGVPERSMAGHAGGSPLIAKARGGVCLALRERGLTIKQIAKVTGHERRVVEAGIARARRTQRVGGRQGRAIASLCWGGGS